MPDDMNLPDLTARKILEYLGKPGPSYVALDEYQKEKFANDVRKVNQDHPSESVFQQRVQQLTRLMIVEATGEAESNRMASEAVRYAGFHWPVHGPYSRVSDMKDTATTEEPVVHDPIPASRKPIGGGIGRILLATSLIALLVVVTAFAIALSRKPGNSSSLGLAAAYSNAKDAISRFVFMNKDKVKANEAAEFAASESNREVTDLSRKYAEMAIQQSVMRNRLQESSDRLKTLESKLVTLSAKSAQAPTRNRQVRAARAVAAPAAAHSAKSGVKTALKRNVTQKSAKRNCSGLTRPAERPGHFIFCDAGNIDQNPAYRLVPFGSKG